MMVMADLDGGEELRAQAEEMGRVLIAMDPRYGWLVSLIWVMAADAARAAATVHDVLAGVPAALAEATALELSFACQAAAAAGDTGLAAVLEPALRPHSGRMLVNAGAVTFCGAVDHHLGLVQACLGRVDEARASLLSAREAYVSLGALYFLGKVDAALAGLGGGGPVTPPRAAVLRRSGDGWEAGFDGATALVPDLRGLTHLWALLRCSGQEVPAVELVSPGSTALVEAQSRDVVLDDTAKRSYRRRIAALQAELEEVVDADREDVVRAELDALLQELRRATGLGGRDRLEVSASERARVAVRKAVTAALDRLAQHDPSFAHLLRSTVRTGTTCQHVPDPNLPVAWSL
jgi:hypothetical protein